MERAKHIARLDDLLSRATGADVEILKQELVDLHAFNPTVNRLGFFETARPAQSSMGRALLTEFPHDQTKYIAWHLELDHPPRSQPLEITLEWKMILDDGTLFTEQVYRSILLPEWKSSWHMASWGWEKPGQWKKGKHKAVLFLFGGFLAEASFTIF